MEIYMWAGARDKVDDNVYAVSGGVIDGVSSLRGQQCSMSAQFSAGGVRPPRRLPRRARCRWALCGRAAARRNTARAPAVYWSLGASARLSQQVNGTLVDNESLD